MFELFLTTNNLEFDRINKAYHNKDKKRTS